MELASNLANAGMSKIAHCCPIPLMEALRKVYWQHGPTLLQYFYQTSG